MATPTDSTSKRKPYNHLAGYRASRHNTINGGWVVIYEAEAQGIDVDGDRYAVVCETHGTMVGTTSMKLAYPLLKVPDFCEACCFPSLNRMPEPGDPDFIGDLSYTPSLEDVLTGIVGGAVLDPDRNG